MPTYEYECKTCGHGFEVFHAMSDPPLKDCPECGKEVRRLIFGGAGVIFKGSGFYVTDRNKSGKTGKAASGESSAKADGSSPCASCPAKDSKEGCPAGSSPEAASSKTKQEAKTA
ncbi:MAG: zinc ribbon domain-containing protein [Treponema sp.]|jgi:putative FmdB family regulatory protein|nr:zinc ribbon domain-containing protein [Treponema sp.]